ncbi:MAG: hypothetical protein FJ265_19130, partial [Planctomycetes bacterium]|nr:hypothetical protein [Planctomycetota bacterium]
MTTTAPCPGAARQRGSALAVTLHVVLLLAVLGQLVYLGSRHRVRVDVTSDGLYSLTQSTRDLLGKLDKQLLIEAYFSPEEKMPVNLRETRTVLDNFLDELVQLGRGKVVLQRFDPNADKNVADKCQRIGVQHADLRGGTATSISFDRHWQGLRFVYANGKQKVVPQIGPQTSFQAEAVLTPAIKEVLTEQKPKFGYMEWPAQAVGQQQPGGVGWNVLRTLEPIAKRYEFQNLKDEDGALLAADVTTLFLFRPKDLTDRQKYVLDQFVVRGGTLVVFADAADYAIGPQRLFAKMPLVLDAPGSEKKLVDQLAHYGIEWRPRLLADVSPDANTPRDRIQMPQEYLTLPQQGPFGQMYAPVQYPYFFHAVGGDWSKVADQLAKDERGQIDEKLAEQYKKQFQPGLPSDEFLFKAYKQLGRGPGFYWPTWVGLRQKAGNLPDLPEGVAGKVLMWSSPAVLVEDPPQSLDPIGRDLRDMQRVNDHYKKFREKLVERQRSEVRQQAPLMVDVRGRFTSCFAGQPRPRRPSEIKEDEAKKAAEEAKKAAAEAKEGEAKADADKPLIGPEPPKDAAQDAAAGKAAPEPDMLTAGEKPGRIVMIGDSDFV